MLVDEGFDWACMHTTSGTWTFSLGNFCRTIKDILVLLYTVDASRSRKRGICNADRNDEPRLSRDLSHVHELTDTPF